MPKLNGSTVALVALATLLVACTDQATAPSSDARRADVTPSSDTATTPALVRKLAAGRGISALPRRPYVRPALVRLGRALAFDKILSGNRDIACTTCHLPAFATGDDKSLSIGQGGSGLGPDRTHPQGVFIPRNAPALFNMSAMRHLFWDGRVQQTRRGHVDTPAGDAVTADMQRVFEFGPVSALGMFPITNRLEMRAASGNELAAIPDTAFRAIWRAEMQRLGAIREYRLMFEAAYPGTRFRDMTFAQASNAIGGFLVSELSFNNTPWDRFLAGNDYALTAKQLEGARTFLTLKCSICHNGATFSDEQFHDVAVAQIGPGEGDGGSGRDDFGRMRVTGVAGDQFRFRTSPLRNVELTAPYGHDGAITTLRDFVAHYSESDKKLIDFDPSQLEPALQGTVLDNASLILAQRDTLLKGVVLSDTLVDKLMDYMGALTDDAARNLNPLVPSRVPSGLPEDRP